MVDLTKIYLVIPAYNEALNLPKVLPEVLALGYNVVVVDDGSVDQSAFVAKNCGAIALRHLTNRGQGAALRTGTKLAFKLGADIVVHFDADGQFLANDILTVVTPILNQQYDIVFGSRFLDNSTKMPVFKEKVIMPAARFVNKLFFGISLTDPQSGFRTFNQSAFTKINWQQDGMAHCTEILHRAHRGGLRITEVPITVIYHEFGQRLSGGFRILKDFFLNGLIE